MLYWPILASHGWSIPSLQSQQRRPISLAAFVSWPPNYCCLNLTQAIAIWNAKQRVVMYLLLAASCSRYCVTLRTSLLWKSQLICRSSRVTGPTTTLPWSPKSFSPLFAEKSLTRDHPVAKPFDEGSITIYGPLRTNVGNSILGSDQGWTLFLPNWRSRCIAYKQLVRVLWKFHWFNACCWYTGRFNWISYTATQCSPFHASLWWGTMTWLFCMSFKFFVIVYLRSCWSTVATCHLFFVHWLVHQETWILYAHVYYK